MPDHHAFDYDVFISYSSKDAAWVRGELLPRIEAAGVRAFIDYRDFTPGVPSIKECERGAKKCPKTLVVLTPNYLKSEWCEFETEVIQTITPANRKRRLIPLLKSSCKPPTGISRLTHIDFTDAADPNHDLAWRQLLTALGKPPEPNPPLEPRREQWCLAHPYPMPPNFTGRVAERELLSRWLNADAAHPLLSLRALGGFGKSALAWQWLMHDVRPADWPRVVWWSFYEGDASFDAFLRESLGYLSGGRIDATKLAGKDAVKTLLQSLLAPGTLLVLDGFERVLRAFGGLEAAYQGDEAKREDRDRDCISPLADLFLYNVAALPQLRGKLLLTTRLCPRVLEARGGGWLAGVREEELRQMQPADAVSYFRAQGIRGTHTEIEAACSPYGYHPLSLCLVAGLIARDFQQPGDIAAARRLDVSGDLIQRQHHVLKTAYDSLAPPRRMLLGRIACFRSPVAYETLTALQISRNALASGSDVTADPEPDASAFRLMSVNLDADLRDLIARGLLHHDRKANRFDLHPIVRRYAYDRLASPDRAAAHTRLRDYFAAVPRPDKVTRLEDLAPVIELYHHTVRAGQLDEAWTLFRDRIWKTLYYQLGGYLLQIDLLRSLFLDGESSPPRLKDESHQAHASNELANSYSLSGQPRRAVPLFEQDIAILERLGMKNTLPTPFGNMAQQQLAIGALRAAEANLRRSIALCREIADEFNEAIGHKELGRLLACRGAEAEAAAELTTALQMNEKRNHVQGQGIGWAYRALGELLRLRVSHTSPQRQQGSHAAPTLPSLAAIPSLALRASVEGERGTKDTESQELGDLRASVFQNALAFARKSLELADEKARTDRPNARDYVRAHWLLGAAHRVAGEHDAAERHLHEALERCRRINLVEFEADILIDLARLRAETGAAEEAQRLAEEALDIAERSGYVLQSADAHLELARLALHRGDRPAARLHAVAAQRFATCDGPPDYTYHAAYLESAALLAQLD